MASKKAEISLSVTISGLALALGGLLCGMVGDNWFKSIKIYKSYNKLNFGLLRMCVSEATCYGRNVLSFSPVDSWEFGFKEELLDDILLALLVSSIFCLFGLIISLIMLFVCRGSKTYWRITVFIDFCCILISTCSAMIGASMSEAFIPHNTSTSYFTQDWTSSVVWSGAICLTVSTFASVFMMFYTPIDDAPKEIINARMFSHTFVDEEVRFTFILDKPARDGFCQLSESITQASVHHHRPSRFISLPVTSLGNMDRYHILEEDYTQYSDGCSEVSASPSYDETINNTH